MTLFIIDTETTGLDPDKHCIWQIGCYYVDDQENVFSLNYKCRPYNMDTISPQIYEICSVTKEELESYPDPKEVYHQFRNFLLSKMGTEKLTWCGYNCQFDLNMMDAFFKHFDPEDSIYKFFHHHCVDMYAYMKILKSMKVINAPSLKLETAYKMFGIAEDTAHDALQDVRVTYMLYKWAQNTILKGLKEG